MENKINEAIAARIQRREAEQVREPIKGLPRKDPKEVEDQLSRILGDNIPNGMLSPGNGGNDRSQGGSSHMNQNALEALKARIRRRLEEVDTQPTRGLPAPGVREK